MSRYRTVRTLAAGPDGPVDEVLPDRIGAEPLARRCLPVPPGPRRHRVRDVAETLARLGHPGIATVVDVADVDEGRIEVVTTLGTHGTLADRAAAGPLGAAELRPVLAAVADALAAAHGAGVSHGHVSATNVVFRDARPLVTDFGLTEARTGRCEPLPFRADVRDLAAMGAELLDPADRSGEADALRSVLRWAGDDPDATLEDLRRGLTVSPAGGAAIGPPPPAPPPGGPQPAVRRRNRPAVLAGAAALIVGLVVGAAAVLLPQPGGGASAAPAREPQLARSSPCPPAGGPLRADVDGDGCDEQIGWRSSVAELRYPGSDGTLLRFRIGRPGDDLVVGDWDCDGTATAGVVRPATGETFTFDAWAGAGETLTATPGPDLPVGAGAVVAGDGGCDRIRPART